MSVSYQLDQSSCLAVFFMLIQISIKYSVLSKQCRPWLDATFCCSIWSGSAGCLCPTKRRKAYTLLFFFSLFYYNRTVKIKEVGFLCSALCRVFNNLTLSSQWERSGSVVECLTQDRGAAGSSITDVTALYPWARTFLNPSLVLVQPRKTRPFITERLLMGRKESNQTNKLSSQHREILLYHPLTHRCTDEFVLL